MTLDCFAICGPGLVRLENQDNLYINGVYRQDVSDHTVLRHANVSRNNGLYAVADGMGGEKHGELAALIAVREMNNAGILSGNQTLTQYLLERNSEICKLIKEKGAKRIGSTFAGLCVKGRNANVVNIGDSRVYLLRGETFTQISRDHTSIQKMINIGILTKEAARSHPERGRLTQYLGISPLEMVIEPYGISMLLEENDLFLLCSDGLNDMLEDSSIEGVLRSPDTVIQKAEVLYAAALQNGGRDNITLILVGLKKGGLFK